MKTIFRFNSWRTLVAPVIFMTVGCGSGGPTEEIGSDTGRAPMPDRSWVRGTSLSVAGTVPTPPPGGDSGDNSGIVGHWFMNRGATRLTLTICSRAGRLTGTLSEDGAGDAALPIEAVTWDSEHKQLRFRVEADAKSYFYAVDVVDGTMIGRYAIDIGGRNGPADWSTNSGHVMAWRRETFDNDVVPRVFDIVVEDGRYARLRIDRSEADPTLFVGEFKLKGTADRGSDGELPAQAVLVRNWDGEKLVFEVANGTSRQRFSGSIKGRSITGSMIQDRSGAEVNFSGTRANVLSYGLRQKTAESRREWQERVRRILYRLMMAGNPAPLHTETTVTDRPVMPSDQVAGDRDDNSTHWKQAYRLSDVAFEHTLPNPYGPDPLTRRGHGILAMPTTPPPPSGYGLVLAVNGHGGSAQQLLEAENPWYWYGEAYARRGYVVLALDMSHRPLWEAGGIYGDPPDGDSPETGNHAHPAVAAPGLDSDWSDDGERVWDAMRGIDFLLSQPSINPNRLIVTGLSMGAEVTEIVGALDPRVTAVVPAGAPPDLSLMPIHGNHPCWQWMHGDATEYIEMSDYLALTAPRHVILETGKADYIYSSYPLPWAVEKENAWRARIAYGDDSGNFVHFLHSAGHQYRVGDASDDSPDPAYIQVPLRIAPSTVQRRSIEWEVDDETVSLGQTLFDYLAR